MDEIIHDMLVSLIIPNWKLEFHVHINTSNIDNTIDCPIYYANELLTNAKKNFTTIKKEALALIYIIKKFDIIDQAMILFFYVAPCHIAFNKHANCDGENCWMGQSAFKRATSITLY